MDRIEGDFEKGRRGLAEESLRAVRRTTRPRYLDGVSPWRTPCLVSLHRLLRRSILWAPRCVALRRRRTIRMQGVLGPSL
jgi:hypothetical protein